MIHLPFVFRTESMSLFLFICSFRQQILFVFKASSRVAHYSQISSHFDVLIQSLIADRLRSWVYCFSCDCPYFLTGHVDWKDNDSLDPWYSHTQSSFSFFFSTNSPKLTTHLMKKNNEDPTQTRHSKQIKLSVLRGNNRQWTIGTVGTTGRVNTCGLCSAWKFYCLS